MGFVSSLGKQGFLGKYNRAYNRERKSLVFCNGGEGGIHISI